MLHDYVYNYGLWHLVICFLYLVILSYNSTPESGFYIGQPLTVRCKLSEIIEGHGLFILALKIGDTFDLRCQREPSGWYAPPTASPPAGLNYTTLTKDDCNLPQKDNTMSVKFIITEGLKNLTIKCHDLYAARYSESFLIITETKREYTLICIQSYILLHWNMAAMHQPGLWMIMLIIMA